MYFNEWITGVQHVAVPTNDLEKTIEFYHSLGFTTALETYNEAAKHRAVFLQLGNLIIESYENGCAVGHPGAIDHIALNTTDIEATYALAKKLNLHMLNEGIRFLPFWENGIRFFTIEGPNAEKIEFCQKLMHPAMRKDCCLWCEESMPCLRLCILDIEPNVEQRRDRHQY